MVVDQREARPASGTASGSRCHDLRRCRRRRRGSTAPPRHGTTPTRSRPPSGRTTRTSSADSCSSSAIRTTPRTSPRTPISRPIGRGTGSTASTSGPGCTRSRSRLAFNQLRGRRRWLAAIGRIEPRPWTDPSDPDLAAALATLDIRTRTALLLNVVDGYTQAEIGRMLSVPEGTVASWISRGRAVLRRELGPER